MFSRTQNITSSSCHNSTQRSCMHLIFDCALKKVFLEHCFPIFNLPCVSTFLLLPWHLSYENIMKHCENRYIGLFDNKHDPDILGLSLCHQSGPCTPTDFIWRNFMLISRKTNPYFHIHIFLFLLWPFFRNNPQTPQIDFLLLTYSRILDETVQTHYLAFHFYTDHHL